MSYTTTEERQFSSKQTSLKSPDEAVAFAMSNIEQEAKRAGFPTGHIVQQAFRIEVFINRGGRFQADAKATYARIVEAAPDEAAPDEYAEHDRRKAAELGMSVEEYVNGVEGR